MQRVRAVSAALALACGGVAVGLRDSSAVVWLNWSTAELSGSRPLWVSGAGARVVSLNIVDLNAAACLLGGAALIVGRFVPAFEAHRHRVELALDGLVAAGVAGALGNINIVSVVLTAVGTALRASCTNAAMGFILPIALPAVVTLSSSAAFFAPRAVAALVFAIYFATPMGDGVRSLHRVSTLACASLLGRLYTESMTTLSVVLLAALCLVAGGAAVLATSPPAQEVEAVKQRPPPPPPPLRLPSVQPPAPPQRGRPQGPTFVMARTTV